jgi:hypothetical protein
MYIILYSEYNYKIAVITNVDCDVNNFNHLRYNGDPRRNETCDLEMYKASIHCICFKYILNKLYLHAYFKITSS